MTGVERLLRLCLAYYSLGDPNPADFGTRQPLLAKNDSLNHFLNAKTSMRFDSSFSMHNKKGTLKGTFSAVVGVTGVEPAASTSQMWRATSCATPRSMYFFVSLDSINYFISFVNSIFYFLIHKFKILFNNKHNLKKYQDFLFISVKSKLKSSRNFILSASTVPSSATVTQ